MGDSEDYTPRDPSTPATTTVADASESAPSPADIPNDNSPDVQVTNQGPPAPTGSVPNTDMSGNPIAPTGGAIDATGQAFVPNTGTTNVPAPAPAGVQSPWKNILMGALYGMTQGAGQTSFGGGMAAGAKAVVDQRQQEVENMQKAKQFQFESVRAADSHILAVKEARAADNANDQHKVSLIKQQSEVNEYAAERGQKPVFTIAADNPNDMHTQAVGGLTTLAQRNGGTIPAVTTTNAPMVLGSNKHKIEVYSPSNEDVKSNPNGILKTVNDARAVRGLPPINDQDFQVAGAQTVKGNYVAGQRQMLQEAQQQLFTVPPVTDKPAENAAISAHLQQQLDTYKQRPDADAGVTKLLTTNLATFNSAMENQRSKASTSESNTTLEQAPSKAETARQEEVAKGTTPLGRVQLQKAKLEVQELQQKVVAGNTGKNYGDLVASDVTGWKPPPGVIMNETQIVSASEKYASSKQFTAAQDSERSYQMMQHAYMEYEDAKAAGKDLPSGAQSMVALSTHLQTTFGNVKGARVTKDMIAEHLGARSISDTAHVAIQKLSNGDKLSENQWDAFHDLISTSRNLAWENASTTAHAMNLPMRGDLMPSDKGRSPERPSGATQKVPGSDGHMHWSNGKADLGMVQ